MARLSAGVRHKGRAQHSAALHNRRRLNGDRLFAGRAEARGLRDLPALAEGRPCFFSRCVCVFYGWDLAWSGRFSPISMKRSSGLTGFFFAAAARASPGLRRRSLSSACSRRVFRFGSSLPDLTLLGDGVALGCKRKRKISNSRKVWSYPSGL